MYRLHWTVYIHGCNISVSAFCFARLGLQVGTGCCQVWCLFKHTRLICISLYHPSCPVLPAFRVDSCAHACLSVFFPAPDASCSQMDLSLRTARWRSISEGHRIFHGQWLGKHPFYEWGQHFYSINQITRWVLIQKISWTVQIWPRNSKTTCLVSFGPAPCQGVLSGVKYNEANEKLAKRKADEICLLILKKGNCWRQQQEVQACFLWQERSLILLMLSSKIREICSSLP